MKWDTRIMHALFVAASIGAMVLSAVAPGRWD